VRSERTWLHHGDIHSNGPVLDDQMLADSDIQVRDRPARHRPENLPVINTDRTIGARVAGAIAQRYGNSGFEGQLDLTFEGSAGQSFGAFNLPA
jgi:glutamate synthase (ferredoxin)